MFVSSVLDSAAIDEKQVESFFSKLTLQKLLYAAVLLVLCAVLIRLILKAADKLFSHSKLDHTIFGFLQILTDQHTFAQSQTVSLQHNRKLCFCTKIFQSLFAGFRFPDPGNLHRKTDIIQCCSLHKKIKMLENHSYLLTLFTELFF